LSCSSETNLDDFLKEAVRFHGHLGPFLVLGLKAGLFANKVLGKDYFKTKAIVETELKPPCSCFVDGVQVATGCTMGKGNIKIKRGKSLSLVIIKDDKVVKMSLKKEILESLKNIPFEEEVERKALEIVNKPISDLFNINISP
jgi:formylmethanofuran dehydrogenase subunit E